MVFFAPCRSARKADFLVYSPPPPLSNKNPSKGPGQGGLDQRENPLHDHRNPVSRGMQAVWLVQFRVAGNPFKKKGIECDPILFSQMREYGVKGSVIFCPKITRGQHADQQYGNLQLPEAHEHGIKVLLRLLRGQRPQGVIGSEREYHQVGIRRQTPVEPGAPSGGGITGNPGVVDPDIVSLGLKGPLQLGGEALGRIKAIPGGEAVA